MGYLTQNNNGCDTCKDDDEYCTVHVRCGDDECDALINPTTIDEYRKALDHWTTHSLYAGCSHGN